MTLFDGINIAEQAMTVHSYRSQVVADNLANLFTPGYAPKQVVLSAGRFSDAMSSASRRPSAGGGPRGAADGAVSIREVRSVPANLPEDYRAQALLGTTEMIESKTAYELSMRAATMMKSMALGALEIGRGQ